MFFDARGGAFNYRFVTGRAQSVPSRRERKRRFETLATYGPVHTGQSRTDLTMVRRVNAF